MIKGENVTWKYHKTGAVILRNVSFALKKGRITTFMGQSGAGKTTLIKCIANLCSQYEGLITCAGEDIRSFSAKTRASTIGCVLQQFHLFPHLTVLENCTYALVHVMGVDKKNAQEQVHTVLEALGIAKFAQALPAQLSGGQQQRAAIARALVLQPKIILLDEPTSALDPESKKSLEALLLELKEKGITLALSSHDMPFIRRVMDQVYFMEHGELVEEWDSQMQELDHTNKIAQFLAHG